MTENIVVDLEKEITKKENFVITAGDITHLGECLSTVFEALSLSPNVT